MLKALHEHKIDEKEGHLQYTVHQAANFDSLPRIGIGGSETLVIKNKNVYVPSEFLGHHITTVLTLKDIKPVPAKPSVNY